MTLQKNNCYVITGGPGVGKTTLLNELSKAGYKTVPEDARTIIKREMDSGGDGLPWKNQLRYTQLMLDAAVKNYHCVPANDDRIYFFDRGILDSICYARMSEIKVSEEMDQLAEGLSYNKKVFILPPWQAIYRTDTERKQSWEEAKWTFDQMKATYIQYGYETIEVPIGAIEDRVGFVLSLI
ncbi:MAG: ATPase [Pedobacter sp.]|nr:MAG: ATPase [Pedobacter sp.]